jgi:hypothetical protein
VLLQALKEAFGAWIVRSKVMSAELRNRNSNLTCCAAAQDTKDGNGHHILKEKLFLHREASVKHNWRDDEVVKHLQD